MLVRGEAGADRHGRAADRDLAILSGEAEIRAFGRVTEMLLGFAEGAVNAVVDGFDREHFFPPCAVLLGHHCPTLTLARGNSECNHQLSQYVWALPRSSSSASLSTSSSSIIIWEDLILPSVHEDACHRSRDPHQLDVRAEFQSEEDAAPPPYHIPCTRSRTR